MKRKILSILLAATMLFSIITASSCTGRESVVGEKPQKGAMTTRSLNNIYLAESISTVNTDLEKIQIQQVNILDDNKLFVTGYTTDNYEMKTYLTDINFNNIKEVSFIDENLKNADQYVNQIIVDQSKKAIFAVKNIYFHGEYDYSIAPDDMVVPRTSGVMIEIDKETVDIAYENQPHEETWIIKLDYDGNVVAQKEISEQLILTDDQGNKYSTYISGIELSADMLVLTANYESLMMFDTENLEYQRTVSFDDADINRLFTDAVGNLYTTSWNEKGMVVKKLDVENETATDVETPQDNYGELLYNITSGEFGYDFLTSNQTALYGFCVGDSEFTEICNYANSDLDFSYGVTAPQIMSDGRLFISYYDYEEKENVILILTKAQPEQLKEKYIITVAGEYINSDLKSAFLKFNRTNQEYKIIFKDYSSYNNEENEWTGAQTQLIKDMISSGANAPDILMFESYFDYNSLVSKGALCDMNVFMEQDESFNRSEYLENVFNALETNNKLYMITPTVTFNVLVGKKSIFADKSNWSMKDFLEMHSSLSEGENMFAEATRNSIGEMLLIICLDEFIDDSGRCSFNSENFKSILEYLKDIPGDYSAYEDIWQENQNYWLDTEMSYSKGLTKLYSSHISDFDVIPELEVRMGEEVTFIGYPTSNEESSGALIYPSTMLAINANSKVKAGAWEAIKSLFDDEYQNKFAGERDENGGGNSYRFPLKKSIIMKKMENDLSPEFYTYKNSNGEIIKEEYGNTYWFGEEEVELRDSTEQDAQRLYDVITNANIVLLEQGEIVDIVNQEAESFYNGEKSVDEVANIINSRVQIYVSERM